MARRKADSEVEHGRAHGLTRAGRPRTSSLRARRTTRSREAKEFTVLRLDSARRAFSSDAEMAEALGVDRAQLPRWREGQVPDRRNADRLAGLDLVVELLTGYLSDSSIPKWLDGINAHLDNRRPLSVLREGRLSEVVAAIEAMKSEAYA